MLSTCSMSRNVAQSGLNQQSPFRGGGTRRRNCEVTESLWNEVQKVAIDRGISGKQLVAEILEQHLCEHTADYLESLAAPAGGNR